MIKWILIVTKWTFVYHINDKNKKYRMDINEGQCRKLQN